LDMGGPKVKGDGAKNYTSYIRENENKKRGRIGGNSPAGNPLGITITNPIQLQGRVQECSKR